MNSASKKKNIYIYIYIEKKLQFLPLTSQTITLVFNLETSTFPTATVSTLSKAPLLMTSIYFRQFRNPVLRAAL